MLLDSRSRKPRIGHDRRSATSGRRAALGQLAFLGLALAGAAGARAQPTPGSEAKAGALPTLGTQLALPEVPMLDGTVFADASAKGQVLVVYWWASWCPFCAMQSPLMDKLWLENRGRGLRMLGLSIDKKPDDARAYLAKRGYSFPSGWVTPQVHAALPKPKGLPVTLVRGRDGRVVMAEAGQLFPEDIEQIARYL